MRKSREGNADFEDSEGKASVNAHRARRDNGHACEGVSESRPLKTDDLASNAVSHFVPNSFPNPCAPTVKVDESAPDSPIAYTFDKLVAEFFASIPERSLEETTLNAMRLHCRHLQRHFKNNFLVQTLTTEQLQEYVNHRARMKSQYKRPISANTIHKELVTFGTMWRWAARCKKVDGMFPRKGCFRHSFISNLACQGVDQRIIDEFVGHTTEQMRRRYRHLFLNVKKEALLRVFG